jgi:anti-sigma regulatory factor (Ser/Thr protein kinase)
MDREIKLCPRPESAREARDFVREQLTELGFPTCVDDATLIVAELASNALAAAPETPYWVALNIDAGGRPVIEVQDCSPELPVVRSVDAMSEHGRGLPIVEALSAAFGCVPVPGGKIVWALLDRELDRESADAGQH